MINSLAAAVHDTLTWDTNDPSFCTVPISVTVTLDGLRPALRSVKVLSFAFNSASSADHENAADDVSRKVKATFNSPPELSFLNFHPITSKSLALHPYLAFVMPMMSPTCISKAAKLKSAVTVICSLDLNKVSFANLCAIELDVVRGNPKSKAFSTPASSAINVVLFISG